VFQNSIIFYNFVKIKKNTKMSKTQAQFYAVKDICLQIFESKLDDYGTAWRIMRPESITDQMYIKAQRIRSIEGKTETKIDEGIVSEFIGLVNYGIIGLIQLELDADESLELDKKTTLDLYSNYYENATKLMLDKNHDYDEAWRLMRVSSYTDLILMKIHRTKQIEDNLGLTKISEGIDANYYDIINYSIFALIKLIIETT